MILTKTTTPTEATTKTTGERVDRVISNPFVGNSLPRSPENTPRANDATSSAASQRRANKAAALASSLSVISIAKAPTPHPCKPTLQKKMEELGVKIDAMLEFWKDKLNVHHAIKNMGSDIKHIHTEAMIMLEQNGGEKRKNEDKTTQTISRKEAKSPKGAPLRTRQVRSAVNSKGNTLQSAKRPRASAEEEMHFPALNAPAAKKMCPTPAKETQTPSGQEAWKLVKSNKNKRKTTIRPKSDAIVITATDKGKSYAEILRTVRSSDALRALGEAVKKIRRTGTGELLLELKKQANNSTCEFQAAMAGVLKETATVAAKTHMVTLQCKDLDEVTTKGEICNALHVQCGISKPNELAIRSMKAAYNGTQTAFISLPAIDAKKVLEAQRIKIGWVSCRLREISSPKRCFRCWGYGHMATRCTETDRTRLCRKCGEAGHMAASCTNKAKCALCEGNHAAGSARCPCFQEAVKRKV